MRLSKILLISFLVVLTAGCSCRTRKVGADADNLPIAQANGILEDVHFAFDSYGIDEKSKSILNTNAAWLKNNPSAKVRIEGHCDERGTSEYNAVLGQHRAQAASDYYRTLGVEQTRLSTISYGKDVPLDPRHNEEAWAKNRRAHHNVQK